jgi:hydroxymethylglutaryl-CoA reductase (NADPH)
VALLASTSYIGLLEGSLFESRNTATNQSIGVDVDALLEGGRHLKVGQETGWKWQSESQPLADVDKVTRTTHGWLLFADFA